MRAAEQVLTAAQMQAAEQALIDRGETVSSLMERAGRGAADWVWRVAAGRPVTVLCGPGNNGGDGYVIARVLQERGLVVSVVAPFEPRTEAAQAARRAWGGEPVAHAHGSVFVDCLFGTGLTRGLADDVRQRLLDLFHAHDRRIAIDLPSGVDSESGGEFGAVLPRYDLTLALGAWKRAHWLLPAHEEMGELRLVDIGIEPVAGAARALRKPCLHTPRATAHKYSRGMLGVVAGEMQGAAVLAATAAMRSGAGYVQVLSNTAYLDVPPDLVVRTGFTDELVADERFSALIVGPGLGRDALAREHLQQALARNLPTVVDGDALSILDPTMLAGRRADLILTPHAGELERLYSACEIEAGDRFERLFALAHDTGSVVIAKGPDTVIADPGGSLVLCASARAPSWLSVAGSGDVLAGVAGSRIAAGRTMLAAAEEAVWLHSAAARLAGPAFTAGELAGKVAAAYAACL